MCTTAVPFRIGKFSALDKIDGKISNQPMALTPSTMLPLGTVAPDFRLPATNGKLVGLSDVPHAKAYLVMFICNHCAYVKHIRAELAKLGKDYQTRGVAIF